MSASSPVVSRRRLAAELRVRREQAGLTIDAAAAQLEWSAAKISRIENAKVSVLPRDVRFLLGIYGASDSGERELLAGLARQARQKPWWHRYALTVPGWFQTYAALEAEASVLASYHPELVPALLRTPAYHRAVSAAPDGAEAEQIGALLSARQHRRDAAGTPHLHAIVSEAVICRPAGGSAVMAAQLEHLARAAATPGITVQVLPFAAGAHPAMDGPFILMTFPDPADPDIACTGPHSALCLDNAAEVQRYQRAFGRLQDMALPAPASVALIAEAAAGLAAADEMR